MKVLLLSPEVLSVAALILSFVARLTDEDWSLSPSARHIPATVRSLKTKTFVVLDSPLLSPEILLYHDQIFSFLSDSLKSILNHDKGARKTSKAWIQSNKTRTLRNIPKVALWNAWYCGKTNWRKRENGMVENDKWKSEYRCKNYGVGLPFFYSLSFRCGGNRIH